MILYSHDDLFPLLVRDTSNIYPSRKRSRRPRVNFTVGTISSFDNLQSTDGISGVAHKPGQITGMPDITYDVTRNVPLPFPFGSSAGQVNQIIQVIFSATANTTTTLTLTGSLTNIVGDALATLSLINYMKVEYLTNAQDPTNGSSASITGYVTLESGASSGITSLPPLDRAGRM